MTWKTTRVAEGGTHHLTSTGEPLYPERYDWVLPFHEPGLAPAGKGGDAFHIDEAGFPAYTGRFSRTFGFYQHRAAVTVEGHWFHILPDGSRLNEMLWDWCGNFQNDRCPVRDHGRGYFHLRLDGSVVPGGPWSYAGDYREGTAVVRDTHGWCRHVDIDGAFLHHGAFFDLDVFHKGRARARDSGGWFHIDRTGSDVSECRFSYLEPFYNGQALARNPNGEIIVIDESGGVVNRIPASIEENLSRIHASAIAYWEPFTIHLGIEAGLAGGDPGLMVTPPADGALRDAWVELGLMATDRITLTEPGRTLSPGQPGRTMVRYWMGPQLTPWIEAGMQLSHPENRDFFADLASDPVSLELVQNALDLYARRDWSGVMEVLAQNIPEGTTVVDIGGGKGALMEEILAGVPGIRGILFERPEVIRLMGGEMNYDIVGGDFFTDPLPRGDVYLLSRVLHDWDDEKAAILLERIHICAPDHASLLVIDRIRDGRSLGLLTLNMVLTTGGRERKMDEWRNLFSRGGWNLTGRRNLGDHHVFILKKEGAS